MRRLVEALGGDYVQWRALMRVSIALLMRRVDTAPSRKRRFVASWWAQPIMYLIFGFFFVTFILGARDSLFVNTLMITYAMFLSGLAVLLDYNALVTSSDDYAILGYRPIDSRTYFLVRLGTLVFLILVISTAIALVPAITTSVVHGIHPERGIALIVAVWTSALWFSLLLVIAYAHVVQRVPTYRVRSVLSYLQMVLSVFVYGGYILVPQLLSEASVQDVVLSRDSIWMFYPGVWFAQYVELVSGRPGWSAAGMIALTLVLVAATVRALSGRVSLQFTERLSAMSLADAVSPAAARPARGVSLFRGGEARAVWLLVRAQFRSDHRFRMGVLSILPVTALYLVVSVTDDTMRDPFTLIHGGSAGGNLIHLGVLMLPTTLASIMVSSERYKAAWVLYATPGNRTRIITSMKNVVFVSFVIPYLTILGFVFLYFFRNPLHVLLHLTVLGMLSHLCLLTLILFNPRLPFSMPPHAGDRTVRVFLITLGVVVFSAVTIPLAIRFVYPEPAYLAAFLFGLCALSFGVSWLGRLRMKHTIMAAEFAG